MARHRQWASVPDSDWGDWRWQQRHRITDVDALAAIVPMGPAELEGARRASAVFPLGVTPYYASLIDPDDPRDPVRAQVVPRAEELARVAGDEDDPLAEDAHMPAPGLTHRYPDRALLYTNHHCAVYCRHCNRRRKVGDAHSAPSRDDLAKAIDYVRRHTEVRDLLVSGGDPLSLSDERLGSLLGELRRIPHLEIIRIATRNPVTLPQRVTAELVGVLREHHPIYVNTHFNHLRECTPEAALALERLADAGCVLGNQMVLLKDVNEDPGMVRGMNQWLLRHRCRPYYIFQCDAVAGTAHFRTPVRAGLNIIDNLRGWTSGLAVPHFVVDLPGGGGKVPLVPDYLVGEEDALTFRNYEGRQFRYVPGE